MPSGKEIMNGNVRHRNSNNFGGGGHISQRNQQPDNVAIPAIVPEVREYLFKLLVIGDNGTGKTSFIKRYVHQYFTDAYRATIGVDFALKVLNWDENTLIRLQLWDISGQERFSNMTRVFYKEAVGAFVVFDVNVPRTFESVLKWKKDLDDKVCLADGLPIPALLLANKCDSDVKGVAESVEKLDKFASENGFCGWYYTSAKENINIDECARFLIVKILQRQKHLKLMDENVDENGLIKLYDDLHSNTSSRSKMCNC